MHYLSIFLAWAVVVGGTRAWSSSEVSCASCGSECQSACGTRNFRACCFNFQRRRRSDSLAHSSTSMTEADYLGLQGLLKPGVSSTRDSHLSQVLRSLSRTLDGSAPDPLFYKDPSESLSSVLASLMQESNEEEEEESDLATSRGDTDGHVNSGGYSGTFGDDSALSRLVALALHRPPPALHQRQQTLHKRYSSSPTNIRK
ncbi:hypothetical protein OTU49_008778 [Cherax quadricarinatus]|uniref:Trissin n=1 Tax=Cherax quadricarinatus TaxID=27406 RepID=A0AAW0WBT8_CHEQU|nr:uncharacterized protein LOC128697600 [Cherax quadricarinatus]